MFPAARVADPVTHDFLVPSGVIGPAMVGSCPSGQVLIEGLPAAYVTCTVICTGVITGGGIVHPPPPGAPVPIVMGSATVHICGMPAARWTPSTDIAACGAFLGDLKLLAARSVFIGGPSAYPTGPAAALLSLALARALVTPGGSGDAHDAELVAQELARFPPSILQQLLAQGTRVVACRGSVTDYRTDLRGVHPRGWPPGTTWDTVPGLNSRSRNEVVIATTGHGTPAGAHVPQTGEGHGCHNLVLHEGAHALDLNGSGPPRSSQSDFVNARNADASTLSSYESQSGSAGREETYAESASRYYGGDPNDAAAHPNLHNYWASDPLGAGP